jgi:aldehyde:ferredoxin oxidoreductase
MELYMLGGYAGRILFVDLTSGKSRDENLSREDIEMFIGGYGINSSLAWKLIEPKIDPFMPENPIILGAGPFTGTIIPGGSKLVATIKFPLNGAFGSGVAGCRFPFMLKTCGYDHLVVIGRSPRPVYILISDECVRLEDAQPIQKMDILDKTDWLLKKYEPCSVLPAGPSGESLVRISITLVDKGGTLGSGGLPAIMGSKNLSAIVVKMGRRPVKIARKRDFLNLVNTLTRRILAWPQRNEVLKGGIRPSSQLWWGTSPARTPVEISREYMDEEEKNLEFHLYLKSRRTIACPSCPIGDKERIEFGEIRTYLCHLKQELRGGVDDPHEDFWIKVNLQDKADRLGICIHNFLGIISLLTLLFEEGKLTKKDLGFEPGEKGSYWMLKLLEMTSQREGIGDLIADGFPRILKEFGSSVAEYAPHNKGRYILWDPRLRGLGTMEFGELTNPRGAHLQAGGSPSYSKGKGVQDFITHADRMGAHPECIMEIEKGGFNPGKYTVISENWFSLFSSLGLCNRAHLNRFYSINILEDLFQALTGLNFSRNELMNAAQRGWNILRALNLRAGFTKGDDEPPGVWFVPLNYSGNEWILHDYFGEVLKREDMENLLSDYYKARGWDAQGRPTWNKLIELDLFEIAKTLYPSFPT